MEGPSSYKSGGKNLKKKIDEILKIVCNAATIIAFTTLSNTAENRTSVCAFSFSGRKKDGACHLEHSAEYTGNDCLSV